MLDTLPQGIPSGAAVFADAWRRGLTLPPPTTVSDWADSHRIISRKAGAEPGPWRTSRFPYLREIMDCFSAHSPVREVSVKKSTQVGGTEVLNNVAGYVIDHAPGPMMIVMPTLGLAELWSKQRLGPMIEEMPCLAEKVSPARSRDADNTTLLKGFPGGVIAIAGANSSSGLRSMPVKILLMDEIDEYEDDLNDQGSAMELAERRTSTFARRKIGRIGSPTVKGGSRIDKAWEDGDQRSYHVPCPHCGNKQVLVIEQLTDAGKYLCEKCGTVIDEHHKANMLAAGEWIARHPEREARSYHICALYSPLGVGYSWREIADMRAAAKKDPDKEVTFANTILGETYDSATMRIEAEEIALRVEPYKLRTVPRGVLLLTVGVDIQINRFELLLMGWGRGERGWVLDWAQIPADPTNIEDYDQLDAYMDSPLLNCCGISMRPSMLAIDSGNWTHEVYAYARRTRHPVIPVKGLSTGGKQILGRWTPQDVRWNGRVIRNGVNLYPIGTDTAKNTLIGRLVADEQRELDNRNFHFSDELPEDFFEQLSAEKFDERKKRWIKIKGRRNESLDALIYAYAAALHPKIHMNKNRDPEWTALENLYEAGAGDMFAQAEQLEPVSAVAKSQTKPVAPQNLQNTQVQNVPRESIPAAPRDHNPLCSDDWGGRL